VWKKLRVVVVALKFGLERFGNTRSTPSRLRPSTVVSEPPDVGVGLVYMALKRDLHMPTYVEILVVISPTSSCFIAYTSCQWFTINPQERSCRAETSKCIAATVEIPCTDGMANATR